MFPTSNERESIEARIKTSLTGYGKYVIVGCPYSYSSALIARAILGTRPSQYPLAVLLAPLRNKTQPVPSYGTTSPLRNKTQPVPSCGTTSPPQDKDPARPLLQYY